MSWFLRSLALGMAMLALSMHATAHEIRPAYLEIRERNAELIEIIWKQPVVGEVALPLRPVLSSGWLDPELAASSYTDTYLIRRWSVPTPRASLEGQRLTIEGLRTALTDVLVRVVLDDKEIVHMLKPDEPSWVLPALSNATPTVPHYLILGIEHIWTGIDHLLFVLGLMLLATKLSDLLKTITAFTLAHSITLAAAALELVRVPSAPVEAVIALSIMYLAVELVQFKRGNPGLAHRFPWAVALIFGLLHGFGFAGALSEVGLPGDHIPIALLLFNIGIEIGQIAFVAVVLLALRLLAFALPSASNRLEWAMPHVIGSLAAFWFVERTIAALT